ncbi:hypothetical protein OUZ56_029636 [Daphnia magna]|uniref:Secreted protein n=1 Tax=Daphnia magna TaxID=35525 RepID=A0ABR0B7F9_9CRUS|nr:hypothetical protein OUZ56_029636 [Daphnia magna]
MAVVMCLDAMAGFLSSGNQWVLHSGLARDASRFTLDGRGGKSPYLLVHWVVGFVTQVGQRFATRLMWVFESSFASNQTTRNLNEARDGMQWPSRKSN